MKGPKNGNPHLRLVKGGPGQVPSPAPPVKSPARVRKLAPPAWLSPQAKKIWAEYIAGCPWLTHFDVPKCGMFCALYAELQSGSRKVLTTRLFLIRSLMTDIGLDPGMRRRIVGKEPKRPTAHSGYFFDDDGA